MKSDNENKLPRRLFATSLVCMLLVAISLRTPAGRASLRISRVTSTDKDDNAEVYTGTIVSMQGRMVSTGFTLSLNSYTPDEEFKRYLGILVEGDQNDVLKTIRGNKLGYIAATGQVGRDILVARKTQLPDGRTRIAVAFERWLRFAEVRNGYRSEDYPFGIMEIILDAKGKGSGTFIAACQVDMKRDKKTDQYRLELENFGTYPNKVMGVVTRSKKS